MKYIDNELYLEFQELAECGVPESTITKANQRKSPSWDFRKGADGDGRKLFIGYQKLKEEYKALVKARYGDPYDYIAKDPIRKMYVRDIEAHKFYLGYTYGEGKRLSTEHVEKYTAAASWLSLLNRLHEDKKVIKKTLGLSLETFWKHIYQIIDTDKIDLPTTPNRLLARMKQYKEEGFKTMIDWRFGNKLAAKVNDEFSESLLLELLAHPNQYDAVLIAQIYNKEAVQKGYKIITPATVNVWRQKKGFEVMPFREGWSAFEGTYRRQIMGKRPSQPLYLVESDDNHLDLFFFDVEDTKGSKFYHKYKAIVVTDSFNDYVLGYAYGESLTTELVRAAYANAMYHIRYLTGIWHLPHETKTDNWAKAELTPFYESMGNYIPSPVGSKKRGYIEQFFGSPHWKRCIKLGANNYTGNNITARNRGVNTEALKAAEKQYPTVQDDAVLQIENFFLRLRTMPQNNGKSKQQEWLEAWAQLPDSEKRPITDEQFLYLFGVNHKHEISITNKGVMPQINNQQFAFDVPPYIALQSIGKKVSVKYDPYDMNRVLVHDGGSLRFIATASVPVPKALKDFQPGDRRYVNALLEEKGRQVEYVSGKAAQRERVLSGAGVDVESLLIGGGVSLLKEIKQDAELAYQQQHQIGNGGFTHPFDQM
jgi:hypothetical protein